MPQLTNVPLYQPLQPYYFDVDNMPIQALITNDTIINTQVDINTSAVSNAAGSAGSLAVRLATSMDSMGNLTQAAVDATYHHLASHSDVNGNHLVPPTDDYFVMMLDSERSLLSTICSGATAFQLTVTPGSGTTPSGTNVNSTVTFPSELGSAVNVQLVPSSSITWLITQSGPNYYLSAESSYAGLIIQHIYGEIPHTSDYENYTVLSGNYISGSLRVYVNGTRLPMGPATVYVPSSTLSTIIGIASGGSGYSSYYVPTWTANNYSEVDSDLGTFQLNVQILPSDVIVVDYDILIS
jgi:hypothetical protein